MLHTSSGTRQAILAAGIEVVYCYEQLWGWRRMVSVQPPTRRNALGGPATPGPALT